jgi:glutathione synthase/RimK-type ligase-like ATP-grasp enzyme
VQVAELLEEWGATVDLIHVDPASVPRRDHDLYVLRTVNDATLEYAAALDVLGATVLNPYAVSRLCRDREQLAVVLASAAVPFAPGEGPGDHKLYCIGGQLFGVRRVGATEAEKHGRPFTVTPQLRGIAVDVGDAIRADLYGIDIVIRDGRPWVVEVNPFPGFKGVPEAPLRVADYIWATATSILQRAALAEAAP